MVLVGAAVLPHGTMAFDGDSCSESLACRERHTKLSLPIRDSLSKLYSGTLQAAALIADLEPELILLCTPHGINLSGAYGVYVNGTATGDAGWLDVLNIWSEFKASADLDTKRSQELVTHLKSEGVEVQGIKSFAGLSAPLRWGEVVPLWYMQKYLKNKPKYMIISVDETPVKSQLEPERVEAGSKIAEFVRRLEERVVVVISGDLSHSHYTECKDPTYLPNPGYNLSVYGRTEVNCPTEAAQFDEEVVQWATGGKKVSAVEAETAVYDWDPTVSSPHLAAAFSIDPTLYRACGARGLMLLHGLLVDDVSKGAKFKTSLTTYQVPTYFGMMAAVFNKIKQ